MCDCFECEHLIKYSGSRDRYGVPQEPDDYECARAEDLTEDEIEKHFCNGESGCRCFEQQSYDPYIDDYDNRW